MRRFAVTALVLSLVVGTTAAFAVTEALKLERSPISRARVAHVFSPTCGCPHETANLSFRLRNSDKLDVDVVDADGEPVRNLLEADRSAGPVALRWDGRDDEGTVVPDGDYRLRVHLADDRRTIVIPNRVRVDTKAPDIELLSLAPRHLSPDGDGVRDRASISVRLSERARPLVLVDGAVADRGAMKQAGASRFAWRGDVRGHPLEAGSYRVSLQAQDAAGNLSAPTSPTPVRIRFIELVQARLAVRRGGILRFHVRTDASAFRVSLFRRGQPARPVLSHRAAGAGVALHLPGRVAPGRYVLRVRAVGHSDDAVLLVRARR